MLAHSRRNLCTYINEDTVCLCVTYTGTHFDSHKMCCFRWSRKQKCLFNRLEIAAPSIITFVMPITHSFIGNITSSTTYVLFHKTSKEDIPILSWIFMLRYFIHCSIWNGDDRRCRHESQHCPGLYHDKNLVTAWSDVENIYSSDSLYQGHDSWINQ